MLFFFRFLAEGKMYLFAYYHVECGSTGVFVLLL